MKYILINYYKYKILLNILLFIFYLKYSNENKYN